MVCSILAGSMCICYLLIHKSVCSPTDPAIPCSSIGVFIMFVHMLITYCLFAALCQLSVFGHNIYGMFLCIAYLDAILFVCVCFLSPFLARIVLHLICGEHFMMFQYSVYQIICMLSKLIPEILFSCDECYFKLFAVLSYYVASVIVI